MKESQSRGTLTGIFTAEAEGAPTRSQEQAHLVPGRGIEGDRYFNDAGRYTNPDKKSEVTLIEQEALDALARDHGIELAPGASRRNLITRGVALNHLVGRRFRIGEVVLEGQRLCEPCGYLEGLTQQGVKAGLVHRGGLRARVVTGGSIRVGDPID